MSTSFSKNKISKKNSNPNNKNIVNKIPIKNNEIPLPHFNTLDSSFLSTMEQLVSNDKSIREKAAEKAKKFLNTSYSNAEELYQKISRSLFYFFWNTDKPSYQLAMAKLIASFIYINPDDKNKLIPKNRLWISTFLSEMSKKFQSIDALRLDKYVMMIDQVMSIYLNACLENKLFKSVICLINYFIKESENNNNFNFTFEANKIKVISRFIKLILNSDDKIEGNIKNKEEFLNNEESGFATFYKKLLFFYIHMKDKREIKNFQDNIFQTILDGLNANKKLDKNLKLINKIEEINEKFMKEYKNEFSGNKNLNLEFFLNKMKNGKYPNPVIQNKNKENNVVDPVNDYIMKKKYLQKFKKSKEEIKKERLEKKLNKNKTLNNDENIEKNKNDDNEIKNEEKSDKKKKSEKKEKLDKMKNIVDELNFDDIQMEKQIIDLKEEDEEKKEEKIEEKERKKEKHINNNEKNNIDIPEKIEKDKDKLNVLKNKKDIRDKKDSVNKKEIIPKDEIEKITSNNNNIKNKINTKISPKNSSSSGDDDCLIEDSDEDDEESNEEILEENDDDDSSENPSSINNSTTKNKEKNIGEIYSDELMDKYSKELMEEEEEEEEIEDDEEYEPNEYDLDNLAEDMNLIMENYNDQTTLKNTKLNMKQSLLNKKTMRNLKNERKNSLNKDKTKKKKITFSLENNVVSLYNSKIPISLKSKKKNVLVPGISNRQSILKK